jgi:hypothetical protein
MDKVELMGCANNTRPHEVKRMPSRDAFFAARGSLPAAVALLTALRWPARIRCPHCDSPDIGGHGRYWRQPALPRYLKLRQFRRNERKRPY